MTNKQRKQGWYWVKYGCLDWEILYFDGRFWHYNNRAALDSFFHSINESRITTPEEPSVLDKAIVVIKANKKGQIISIKNAVAILEQLKSEV
jgi:hypothetical protein